MRDTTLTPMGSHCLKNSGFKRLLYRATELYLPSPLISTSAAQRKAHPAARRPGPKPQDVMRSSGAAGWGRPPSPAKTRPETPARSRKTWPRGKPEGQKRGRDSPERPERPGKRLPYPPPVETAPPGRSPRNRDRLHPDPLYQRGPRGVNQSIRARRAPGSPSATACGAFPSAWKAESRSGGRRPPNDRRRV